MVSCHEFPSHDLCKQINKYQTPALIKPMATQDQVWPLPYFDGLTEPVFTIPLLYLSPISTCSARTSRSGRRSQQPSP